MIDLEICSIIVSFKIDSSAAAALYRAGSKVYSRIASNFLASDHLSFDLILYDKVCINSNSPTFF